MAKNTCINNEISVQKLVKEDIQPKIDGCDVSICSSDLLPTSFENISEIVLESMPLHIRKVMFYITCSCMEQKSYSEIVFRS